ncbi:MAG: hypothetical protein IJU16_06925 [Clostridia bacterium]|nr:hypothetical protein [Clostridia bacterium]
MFDIAGEKLKVISKLVFGIGVLLSVVSGIVDMIALWQWSAIGAFFIGLLIITLGIFGAWVTGLALHAIGIAAVSAERSENMIRSLAKTDDREIGATFQNAPLTKHQFRCDRCGSMISSFPCIVCASKKQDVAPPIRVDEKTIKCPSCGFTQLASRKKCWRCGMAFSEEETVETD